MQQKTVYDSSSPYSGSIIEPSHASANVHYAIREVVVLARALERQGQRMLYLNIGDPNVYDFDLVDEARLAAEWAMSNRKSSYAPSEGLSEALEAIAKDARERQGIHNIIDVFTGNGASECIDLAIMALANAGDNILLPAPTYPLYAAILGRLGVEARYYRLDESNAWMPDIEHMASLVDGRSRAIVVINPNNPTGSVCSKDILLRIIDIAKAHNLLILNDEIYERLVLDDQEAFVSLASLDDEVSVVTFNGLSKAYLGPGIRMGWGVVSGKRERLESYVDGIHRMLRARLCANHAFQYAVKPCLEGGQKHLPEVLEKLRRRRDICMSRIEAIPGLSCVAPKGTFYAFVRVEGITDDSAWCQALMRATGVVVVPGSGFGYHASDAGYFRIVFLPDERTLLDAFDKIAAFAAEYSGK